jgi:tripartite-type tricarboxylate transporter receptor subunit TctC
MKKILVATFVALLSCFQTAHAQTHNQRDTTIQVVIPQSHASGLAAIYTHLEKFASKKNISMIPVYKPGANGTIGITYASKQNNNNVLLLSTVVDYVNASSEKNFKNIGAINEIELALVASKKSGIKTINDLVKIEKTTPGKLNWAQMSLVTDEFTDKLAKIYALDKDTIHRIPYKDPKITDIVNGDLDLAFIFATTAKSLEAAQLITIVDIDSAGRQRLTEKKHATALFTPAGTDESTVKFWNNFLNEFLADNDVRESFRKSNIKTFDNSSPEKLETIIANWKNK